VFAQIKNVDPGAHDITINIVHDDTHAVVLAASAEVPENHSQSVDLVIPGQGAEFQKEGKHVMTLNIDGIQAAYQVLNVSLIKQQQGG
jgi:hypothetical protein